MQELQAAAGLPAVWNKTSYCPPDIDPSIARAAGSEGGWRAGCWKTRALARLISTQRAAPARAAPAPPAARAAAALMLLLLLLLHPPAAPQLLLPACSLWCSLLGDLAKVGSSPAAAAHFALGQGQTARFPTCSDLAKFCTLVLPLQKIQKYLLFFR